MIKKVVDGRIGFLKIAAILFAMFLFSCSPVKFVPQNEYLINKVDVEIDNADVNKTEAKSYIRQKENYKILGFLKFHLMMYNLSSKKKTEDWLKRIGEPPQIYSEDLSNRSDRSNCSDFKSFDKESSASADNSPFSFI